MPARRRRFAHDAVHFAARDAARDTRPFGCTRREASDKCGSRATTTCVATWPSRNSSRDQTSSGGARARFLREAHITGQLEHPGIRSRVRVGAAHNRSAAFLYDALRRRPDLEPSHARVSRQACGRSIRLVGVSGSPGIRLDELIGRPTSICSRRHWPKDTARAMSRILTTGTTYEATEEVIDAEGERRRIQIIKLPVRDGQGTIIGTQGIFWTISPAS